MNVTVYEVGPRDGLQSLKFPISTSKKTKLIDALYDAGLTEIEEVSFAHPKLVPQMADAEKVYQRGGALVMNKRGFDRAIAVGAKKINIVISPCETFNMKNMGKTRSELVLMYKTFLDKTPKKMCVFTLAWHLARHSVVKYHPVQCIHVFEMPKCLEIPLFLLIQWG